jgi:GTP-binding protein
MPEYAFIGRSNVGKSSLINMLTNQNQRVGQNFITQPAKPSLSTTDHRGVALVDLSQGYARIRVDARAKWPNINFYLRHRPNPTCVMVLLDSRHTPQAVDLEFIKPGTEGVPFVMVFNSADKQSSSRHQPNVVQYLKKCRNMGRAVQYFCYPRPRTNGSR